MFSLILGLIMFISPIEMLDKYVNYDRSNHNILLKNPLPDSLVVQFIAKDSNNFNPEFFNYIESEGMINEFIRFYYFDFDNDGINEVFFAGNTGSESDCVIIYKWNGVDYIEMFQAWGLLISIIRNQIFNSYDFIVHNYPCCGGYINHLEYYTPTMYGDSISFLLSNVIAFSNETEFPHNIQDSEEYFITNGKDNYLRSTPEVSESLVVDYELSENNIIANYPAGCKLKVLYSKTIDNIAWNFVLLDEDCKPIETTYHNGDNNFIPAKLIGWIEAKSISIDN